MDAFLDYVPRLKSQLQAGPGFSESCRSKWVFPIENFAEDVESYIRPLRERLSELAAELLLPARQDALNKMHAGLQSQKYPVAWLRAHDLLTGLGDGMDVRIPRAQLQAHLQRTAGNDGFATSEPSAGAFDLLEPNSSFHLKSDEPMLTSNGERILVPKGARAQVLGSAISGDDLHLRVSCTLLELSQVKKLLAGVTPRAIVGEDVPEVLSLLHGLRILCWFDEAGLRENVLLAIRKVAVAFTRIISLRFWAEKGLQHSDAYRRELLASASAFASTTSLRRLYTEGLVNRYSLAQLWKQDFDQSEIERMTNILAKIMEQKGLVLRRAFQNDFVVPCCLPAAVVPESAREDCELCCLNLGGLITPTNLSQTADMICKNGRGSRKLSPGPPQIFRNYVELCSEKTLISMCLSPADGFQLLRIRVTSSRLSEDDAEESQSRSETRANELSYIIDLLFDCLGIEKRMRSKLVVTSEATHFDPQLFLDGQKLSDVGFLKQRFLSDLNPGLAKVVRNVCMFSDVRPAGSLRFSSMLCPCDVVMEEYVVAVEEDQTSALGRLVEWLKRVAAKCAGEANIYWGGLTAGEDPTYPGKVLRKVLTWSTDEILKGNKVCVVGDRQEMVPFDKALEEGNKSRTAFITIFAKVCLFSGQSSAERFFEIRNGIRFGHVSKGQLVPVTKEYHFLEVLDACLFRYSGETPEAMKYARASAVTRASLQGF